MKHILILTLSVGLFACGETKEIVEDNVNETTEEVAEDKAMVDGVVKTNEDCGFVIEVQMEGRTVKMEPANLDDQFKRDGLNVKFLYSPMRIQSNCGGMPVNIEKMIK